MLSRAQNVQECDATGDAACPIAGSIILLQAQDLPALTIRMRASAHQSQQTYSGKFSTILTLLFAPFLTASRRSTIKLPL